MNQTDFILSYITLGTIGTIVTAQSMNYNISLTRCVRAFIFSPPRIIGSSIIEIADTIDRTLFG